MSTKEKKSGQEETLDHKTESLTEIVGGSVDLTFGPFTRKESI